MKLKVIEPPCLPFYSLIHSIRQIALIVTLDQLQLLLLLHNDMCDFNVKTDFTINAIFMYVRIRALLYTLCNKHLALL